MPKQKAPTFVGAFTTVWMPTSSDVTLLAGSLTITWQTVDGTKVPGAVYSKFVTEVGAWGLGFYGIYRTLGLTSKLSNSL